MSSVVRKIGTPVTVPGLVAASGFPVLMLPDFLVIASSPMMTVRFSPIGDSTVMTASLAVTGKVQGWRGSGRRGKDVSKGSLNPFVQRAGYRAG